MIRLPLFLALFAGYAVSYAGEDLREERFWPMLGWFFVASALWVAAEIALGRMLTRRT